MRLKISGSRRKRRRGECSLAGRRSFFLAAMISQSQASGVGRITRCFGTGLQYPVCITIGPRASPLPPPAVTQIASGCSPMACGPPVPAILATSRTFVRALEYTEQSRAQRAPATWKSDGTVGTASAISPPIGDQFSSTISYGGGSFLVSWVTNSGTHQITAVLQGFVTPYGAASGTLLSAACRFHLLANPSNRHTQRFWRALLRTMRMLRGVPHRSAFDWRRLKGSGRPDPGGLGV